MTTEADSRDRFMEELIAQLEDRNRELAATRQALTDLVTAAECVGASPAIWTALQDALAAARVVLGEDTTNG